MAMGLEWKTLGRPSIVNPSPEGCRLTGICEETAPAVLGARAGAMRGTASVCVRWGDHRLLRAPAGWHKVTFLSRIGVAAMEWYGLGTGGCLCCPSHLNTQQPSCEKPLNLNSPEQKQHTQAQAVQLLQGASGPKLPQHQLKPWGWAPASPTCISQVFLSAYFPQRGKR